MAPEKLDWMVKKQVGDYPGTNEGHDRGKRLSLPGKPWLSVVVIGRNEARNLPQLFRSLPRGEDVEWIYVDSCSDDESVTLALEAGARVYRVAEASVCGPGTGRFIGTGEAAGRWILYLDGDMILRPEFISLLEQLKDNRGDEGGKIPPGTAGFVGRTRNLYLDHKGEVAEKRDYVVLAPKEMGLLEDWGRPAGYHGGAVLYCRDIVLQAGNWNPAVLQLEEIDLYSRVRSLGKTIRAVDLPMVDHYAPALSLAERVKLNFLPRYRGKNLYGAGQVVAARFRAGTLPAFIRHYPYPFLVLAGLVAIPPLFLIWPPLPLLVNLALAAWIGAAKKWYYYLVYLGNLFQIWRGLFRYRPFEPRYERIVKPG